MRHWIVYHNPDQMDGPPEKTSPAEVVTNQPTSATVGDIVYLLTGTGRPRVYSLVCRFAIDDQRTGKGKWKFNHKGSSARWPSPSPTLNNFNWLKPLARRHGNFAFGMRELREPSIIRDLDNLAVLAG